MSSSSRVVADRLREAVIALKELRTERDALARARTEPIAIVGMACRFPGGAVTPDDFWRLLEGGEDAVAEVPAGRWRLDPDGVSPSDPASRAVRWGAFLEDVDLFDAHFFGITPREATSLDPQQRLLLEVAWEALESGGQVPDRLSGTRTGVFLGINTNDYALLCGAFEPGKQDIYAVTGNGHCFPAGRLSYTLGLEGPSMTVDTACSSSLVAVHLACQSLRSWESSLALAGGVSLMLSPAIAQLISTTGALSPDGRCKTFDAEANGFVRGEGCGVVALKRLSDAQSDGDPILAVIRGSAVNQDGRSTGLTAPSVLAQQAMLRQALESARVAPSEIGYVETHGTGTSLGDPIEVEALAQVLGKPREDGSTCALGALKTRIGHLEAAAGVAGLIKAVMVLQRQAIPANLHFTALNPRIDLEGTSLVIPTRKVAWESPGKGRIAGVSAFGMSGSNAHIVLEEAPPAAAPAPDDEHAVELLPLSARSAEALFCLARDYAGFLSRPPAGAPEALKDIVYTAGSRRSHHGHRLAVVGSSRSELVASLQAFVNGEAHPGAVHGKTEPGARQKVIFVFSGQGSQWVGMGRELLAQDAGFRASIEACDALVQERAGWSLLAQLAAPEEASRLHETEVAQPAIFAVQVAVAALLRRWGVTPSAVVGHSVGEIAAAHVAGALSLEDAVRLVVTRGRIMQRAAGLGKMATVALSAEEATRVIEAAGDRLAVAAINDPRSVVLAGEADALAVVLARLQRDRVPCRLLRVDHAFHSPQTAPFQRELERALTGLAPRRAALAMYSTVTGARIAGEALDAAYWAKNIREPVLFSRAVDAAIADGHQLYIEIGPHPTLSANVEQNLLERRADGHAVFSLQRGREERRCMLRSLGALYAHGHAVEWKHVYPAGGRCVSLPAYPWQRERYWAAGSDQAAPRARPAPRTGGGATEAPFLEQLTAAPALERRSRLEGWLRQIVARTFGAPDAGRIDPAANLFDLGIDSLMSLELRDRIHAGLGLKLSVNYLFSFPTVASLAEHALDALKLPAESGGELGSSGAGRWSPLVALQAAGGGTPFFCVHPLGGPVLCYAELARGLGADRPFYGLQAFGLDDDQTPDDRVETMAARYLEAVRAVQPSGPYLLGGWSFGGLVAFEMASQLVRSGESVALLALIDGYFASWQGPDHRLWHFVASAKGINPESSYAELRGRGERELVDMVLEGAMRERIGGFTDAVKRLGDSHGRAVERYEPRCYPGRVTYFRAAQRPPYPFGPVSEPNGGFYQPIARYSSQPIELHEVPGSHYSMLREPHVRGLAEQLKLRLRAADPKKV
jgi:acyl transferase domain-containing protein/thioesterase domain-containing protein